MTDIEQTYNYGHMFSELLFLVFIILLRAQRIFSGATWMFIIRISLQRSLLLKFIYSQNELESCVVESHSACCI